MSPWAQGPCTHGPGARGRAPGRGQHGFRSVGNPRQNRHPEKATLWFPNEVVTNLVPGPNGPWAQTDPRPNGPWAQTVPGPKGPWAQTGRGSKQALGPTGPGTNGPWAQWYQMGQAK